MQAPSLPDLDYFLEPGKVLNYPYNKTFDEARLDPLVVLHTSGSTGIPKAVTVTHGTFSCIDAYQMIPSLGGAETIGPSLSGTRLFLAFPLFHAAALCYLLGLGIYCGVICVLPPPNIPMTAESVDMYHRYGNIQSSALPPSMVVDIFKNPIYLGHLENLKHLIYAGGSLPNDVGHAVSTRTNLVQLNGSTEVGLPALEPCDSSEWDYVHYSPFGGNEFRPVGVDGLYEHYIVRNREFDMFQGVFSTFPGIDEYSMKDLYEKHPIKEDLWRFRGRLDDIIVFLNAEKLNPVDMEGIISAHPAIRSAIVGGHGKFQSCLLLELVSCPGTVEDRAQLLDGIWPTIERANQDCPSYGRVLKDFILFTTSEKPVLRTGKGTVQRQLTLDLYENEINKLYDSTGLPKTPSKMLVDDEVKHAETLGKSLHEMILTCTWRNKNLTPEADFFELGLDSLQVVALTRQINALLITSALPFEPISTQTIYSHSSIRKLEAAIIGKNSSLITPNRIQRMQDTLVKYSSRLPASDTLPVLHPSQGRVILLTGSTGSLGSYLLDALTTNPEVEKIYCANRGKSLEKRQTQSHLEKGLSADISKVSFLEADLNKPHLGLTETTHIDLLRSVTHIIHNAWNVNFNRSFESFANTYIHGVWQLIDFCLRSEHQARLLFVSSESTVKEIKQGQGGHVSENVSEDWTSAVNMGYAESKLAAERLIAVANQRSSLRATICRVGQIAGPTIREGIWSKHEWIPSLIASSVHLGKFPASLGSRDTIDWIPVDFVSRIIIDLLFAPDHFRKGKKRKRSIESLDNPFKKKAREDLGVVNRRDGDELTSGWSTTNSMISLEQSQRPNLLNSNGKSNTMVGHIPMDEALQLSELVDTASMALRSPLTELNKHVIGAIEKAPTNGTTLHIDRPTSQKGGSSSDTLQVFHVVNPSTVTWPELVPMFQRNCDFPLEGVEYIQWLDALGGSVSASQNSDDNTNNPAIKLMNYYKHIEDTFSDPQAVLSTDKAVKESSTMATLEAVSEEWIENWMRQWGFSHDRNL